MKDKIFAWAKNHPIWSVIIALTILGLIVNLFDGPGEKMNVSPQSTTKSSSGDITKVNAGINSLLKLCEGICLKGSWDNENDLTLTISDQWYVEAEYQQERLTTVMFQAWITILEESGFSTDTATLYIQDSYGKRLAKYSAVFGYSRS